MATAVLFERQPLARIVRRRTVAIVLSIGCPWQMFPVLGRKVVEHVIVARRMEAATAPMAFLGPWHVGDTFLATACKFCTVGPVERKRASDISETLERSLPSGKRAIDTWLCKSPYWLQRTRTASP